jgi:methenyltetrahydromethanopterin cyclohydrolase
MNDTVKTPTVADLRNTGYKVGITHNRVYKMAYTDFTSGKIVVKNGVNPVSTLREANIDSNSDGVLYELLPKGGRTEVTVTDEVNKIDFMASATCREDENYDKRVGVSRCLDRIIGLMLVCEYQNKDGFKVRVGT